MFERVIQEAKGDAVVAIRSLAFAIGKLVASAPAELREKIFQGVILEAKNVEKVIRSVGLDGRAEDIREEKVKKDNTKLW